MHKMSVVMTTAIQTHVHQPSGESHHCLTGIRQEDILGNKISEAYSVFGSSPSANKCGNEYWFYCDIHLPAGFTNCLEPVSPPILTTAIKSIIRLFVVKILQLMKQFGNCLIDCLGSCRSAPMSQARHEVFTFKPNVGAEEGSHHPGCMFFSLTVGTEEG